MVVRSQTVRKITLVTGYDDNIQVADIAEKLEELKQSLLELDVELEVKLNPNMHDREIRIDNGWVVKIGRGLDFFQKPGGWFEVGANDLTLRKCLETKVDIFKA
jgi:ATP-dependent Lon protease